MNVELLRKIAAVIQKKPAQFDMKYLHCDRNGEAVSEPFCGTAHCICGWAAVLLDKRIGAGGFARAIRVSPKAEQRLIFTRNWPASFEARYEKAKQRRTKAKIAAARIEHFIETGGRE